MNRCFSVYLDFIRFLAAVAVFVSHVPAFAGGWLWQVAGFGHEAVVVFFVLSGFVISYVVYEKKETLSHYAVSRLSRIYSVALPAILITLFLYYLGMEINGQAFELVNEKQRDPVWTVFSAFLFINQSWIATPFFSNLPYWSIGYEVLYYLFFGVAVFSKGPKRIGLMLIVFMLMGPSILLYLPLWCLGVLCFKLIKRVQLSFSVSAWLYLMSLLGLFYFLRGEVQSEVNAFVALHIYDGVYKFLLEPADHFASDYLLGMVVFLNIFSAYHLTCSSNFFKLGQKANTWIKEASAHTFSLYLLHMPMLFFISALFPYDANSSVNLVLCWVAVPLSIFFLSRWLESHRGYYRRFFDGLFLRYAT